MNSIFKVNMHCTPFWVIIFFAVFTACKTVAVSTGTSSITGIYTEHWQNPTTSNDTVFTSDVAYVDTLSIQDKGNANYTITCLNNKDYFYSRINFNGSQLKFTMENKTDPNEKFFVYYDLLLNKDNNAFNGTVVNSKKHTIKVELKKIK